MASRGIAIVATAGLVAAMIAPAFGQSSGTGTGSAPATGSGSSMPTPKPAAPAAQPGTSAPAPAPGASSGAPGKAKSGTDMGQSGSGSMSKPATAMQGGSSEQVKSVQQALQGKGMDPGPIDGIMGPKTMAALKAFQKDQKLTESGRLDDQTREKLGVSR
jgi:peptidoglycan hydrolase-like protein with peptidoglycan-binding domain